MFLSSSNKTDVMAIKVSLVEDDDLVRESLAVLINGASGFTCVGAYATSEEALERVAADAPDVVLMDIHLPKMSGVECVRRLKAILPGSQIIMLTMYEDDKLVFDSLRAGATGYLLKRTQHALILAAIEDVLHGGSPMTSSIARKVVQIARHARAPNSASETSLPHLSPRELEIL